MSFSIVIPSKSIENLTACVAAIRAAGETARIIVVDDGVKWPWEGEPPDSWGVVESHCGEYPFIFARNCNIGIYLAGTDDVVLMNDDAILTTEGGYGGLTALGEQANRKRYGEVQYAMVSPSFDFVGTPNLIHRPWHGQPMREEKVALVFACVYIPRRTFDTIGLLDERFCHNAGGPGPRGYGLEDDDFSWRCRKAGMKLGVYDGVLVNHLQEHTGLRSTFRDDPEHPWDVKVHERIFELKHGRHPRRP